KPPAAPPAFVTHSPESNRKRIRAASLAAQRRKRSAACGRVAIFHPLVKVECLAAAKVSREIRLRPRQFAEASKLVRAKFVRLVFLRAIRRFPQVRRVRPKIRALGTVIARANAVAPVVAVGKTAARPAD